MFALSVVGILLAFAILIFAAYKKVSMFLAAIIAAAVVAFFSGLPVVENLIGAEGAFRTVMTNFVGSWLIIFPSERCLVPCMIKAEPPGG